MSLPRNDAPVSRVLVFTMPDEGTPIDFARWLETRLTEPDFHQLIAELESVRAYVHPEDDVTNPASNQTIENLLGGEQVSEILEKGLSILSSDDKKTKLQALYSNTIALEELHFRIYAEGGEYWQKKIESAASASTAMTQKETKLPENTVAIVSTESKAVSAEVERTRLEKQRSVSLASSRNQSWVWPAAMSAICSAAAVFAVMIYLPKEPSREQFACQWTAAELKKSTASKDFFRKVTYLAAWPEEPQKDAATLAREIAHYRSACSELIMSDFQVLSAADQKFFRDRCIAWSSKFDAQLLRIEKDGDAALKEVHIAVGEIIKQLKKTLKEKTDSVG